MKTSKFRDALKKIGMTKILKTQLKLGYSKENFRSSADVSRRKIKTFWPKVKSLQVMTVKKK